MNENRIDKQWVCDGSDIDRVVYVIEYALDQYEQNNLFEDKLLHSLH